ncbi:LCP family protein [Saccharopolyspora sp. NPDC047091]|uniref:LCP family protein n=1 Tax=Saccharopolyspora sp. NPDC047091 TaxID=3155924 RepID=UPI00340849D1
MVGDGGSKSGRTIRFRGDLADAEQVLPMPPTGPPVRRRGSRALRAAGRTLVALVSTLVLLVTGYGWNTLGALRGGLATSDVTAGAKADGSLDVLLVGLDGRTDAHGDPLPPEVLRELHTEDSGSSLTDTLILLHVPADRSRAVAYSLPRDSYVDVPGHGHHKINSAYGRGKAAERKRLEAQGVTDPAALERGSADGGRKLLVRTVQQLTGVDVDHYAEVNLLGFYQLTKAIGGVEVCLNDAVDDPYSGARFAAGRQRISGGDALAFVRQRHGLLRGDLDRVQRQQAFLAGLARAMLATGTLANPAKLDRIFTAVEQSVVLDEGWDPLAFAADLRGLAGGDITFGTIPVEDPEHDTPDGQAVQVNPHKVQLTIGRVNDGLPAAPPRPVALESAVADVLNGTDTGGMAGRVQAELGAEDIAVGEVADGPLTATSRVTHHPDDAEVAAFIAEHLGGLATAADPAQPRGHVQVLLGADYDDPNVGELAPAPLIRLDGHQVQRSGAAADVITADGIPCIN